MVAPMAGGDLHNSRSSSPGQHTPFDATKMHEPVIMDQGRLAVVVGGGLLVPSPPSPHLNNRLLPTTTTICTLPTTKHSLRCGGDCLRTIHPSAPSCPPPNGALLPCGAGQPPPATNNLPQCGGAPPGAAPPGVLQCRRARTRRHLAHGCPRQPPTPTEGHLCSRTDRAVPCRGAHRPDLRPGPWWAPAAARRGGRGNHGGRGAPCRAQRHPLPPPVWPPVHPAPSGTAATHGLCLGSQHGRTCVVEWRPPWPLCRVACGAPRFLCHRVGCTRRRHQPQRGAVERRKWQLFTVW